MSVKWCLVSLLWLIRWSVSSCTYLLAIWVCLCLTFAHFSNKLTILFLVLKNAHMYFRAVLLHKTLWDMAMQDGPHLPWADIKHWHAASATEELNFKCYWVLINLNSNVTGNRCQVNDMDDWQCRVQVNSPSVSVIMNIISSVNLPVTVYWVLWKVEILKFAMLKSTYLFPLWLVFGRDLLLEGILMNFNFTKYIPQKFHLWPLSFIFNI